LITKITDQRKNPLYVAKEAKPDASNQVIEPRNAFLMTSLLQEVTTRGTAARAAGTLKRTDIYGKTGTTNDAIDAWFAGYHESVVAVAWVGHDTPKNLGSRETGGGLSLPIWIRFMEVALKGVPVTEPVPPEGITRIGNDWYFSEYTPELGIKSLGLNGENPESSTAPKKVVDDERRGILDLFRN
jgi:penicillin-binding protein 1A